MKSSKVKVIITAVVACVTCSCESTKDTRLMDASLVGEWIVDPVETLPHLVRKDLQEAAENDTKLLKDRLSKVYLRIADDGYYTAHDGGKYTTKLISETEGVWTYEHGVYPNLTISFKLLNEDKLKRVIHKENGNAYEVHIFKRKSSQ